MVNCNEQVAPWPEQHGGAPLDRGVAILTQGSNIALSFTMQNCALPLAFSAMPGNQAQTGISRPCTALLDEPGITAPGPHSEGIDDLTAFQIWPPMPAPGANPTSPCASDDPTKRAPPPCGTPHLPGPRDRADRHPARSDSDAETAAAQLA